MRYVAIVLSLCLLGGCAKSSSQQYRIASSTYAATIDIWADLIDAGYISREAALKFDSLEHEARVGLEQWADALEAEGDFDGAALVKQVIARMVAMRIEAERSEP